MFWSPGQPLKRGWGALRLGKKENLTEKLLSKLPETKSSNIPSERERERESQGEREKATKGVFSILVTTSFSFRGYNKMNLILGEDESD